MLLSAAPVASKLPFLLGGCHLGPILTTRTIIRTGVGWPEPRWLCLFVDRLYSLLGEDSWVWAGPSVLDLRSVREEPCLYFVHFVLWVWSLWNIGAVCCDL